jgi:hypothetical protein
MPPMKKSKKAKRKSKDSSKLKVARTRSAPPPLPPELRGLDTEWWYTFLHKHAETGMHTPPDSSLSLSRTGAFSLNSPPWLLHSPPNLRRRALHPGFPAAAAALLHIRARRSPRNSLPRWACVGRYRFRAIRFGD